VNRALDHPALRALGAEVVVPVLARALVHGFGAVARLSWLVLERGRLSCRNLPSAPPIDSVRDCLESLVDQVWCLLGSEVCKPFHLSLRTAVFGV
jgi:hypothetical protein